jgi:hypothetical protein
MSPKVLDFFTAEGGLLESQNTNKILLKKRQIQGAELQIKRGVVPLR